MGGVELPQIGLGVRGLPSSVVCSQEVWGGAPIGDDPLLVRDGVEKLGLAAGPIIERQDGRNVPAPVAVVGRRPDRDQVLVGEHVLVALLDQLVGPADELEPVDVAELAGRGCDQGAGSGEKTTRGAQQQHVSRRTPASTAWLLVQDVAPKREREKKKKKKERKARTGATPNVSRGIAGAQRRYLLGDLGAEEVASTARADGPVLDIVRVGPDEVAKRTLVRDLLVAVDRPDLVDGGHVRREAAVHAKDPAVNQRCHRQQVKDLGAIPPRIRVPVLVLTFVCDKNIRDIAGGRGGGGGGREREREKEEGNSAGVSVVNSRRSAKPTKQ